MGRALWSAVALVAMSGGAAPAQAPERGTAPGRVHLDPWLPDLDGKLRQLSEWGGRKLFVFHFASW